MKKFPMQNKNSKNTKFLNIENIISQQKLKPNIKNYALFKTFKD